MTKTKRPTKQKAPRARKEQPAVTMARPDLDDAPRVPGSGPVPPAVLKARDSILAAHSGGGDCTRCGGAGYLEDNPTWIVAEGKKGTGKVCFRCLGDGVEPKDSNFPDPLTVRMNVVARLINIVNAGDVRGVTKLAAQFRSGPFWPVLEDAFQRAQTAASTRQGTRGAPAPVPASKGRQGGPQRARGVKERSLSDHLSRGMNAHFAAVLDKHHPDASPEELAEALGGHATFGGDVVFYDESEDF